MIWFGKSFIKFCKSFINLIKLVSTRTCSSARVRGQTRYTRILDSKPWSVHISHWTWIGFEIFSLSTIFSQCPLSSSLTSEKRKLRTWNFGQIFEVELWLVGWLVMHIKHSGWLLWITGYSVNAGLIINLGVRVEKPSLWALVFKYCRQFMGQVPFVTFVQRLYNSYNHAHSPGQHLWLSPGLWPLPLPLPCLCLCLCLPVPLSHSLNLHQLEVLQKKWKSDLHFKS